MRIAAEHNGVHVARLSDPRWNIHIVAFLARRPRAAATPTCSAAVLMDQMKTAAPTARVTIKHWWEAKCSPTISPREEKRETCLHWAQNHKPNEQLVVISPPPLKKPQKIIRLISKSTYVFHLQCLSALYNKGVDVVQRQPAPNRYCSRKWNQRRAQNHFGRLLLLKWKW